MISKIAYMFILSRIALSISVTKTDCHDEIQNVQTKLLSQRKEITFLRNRVDELETQKTLVEKIEHDVQKLLEKEKLNQERDAFDIDNKYFKSSDEGQFEQAKERRKRLAASGVQVGFTASVPKEVTNSVMFFSHLDTNVGSAYNVNDGMFTANQPGLYAFFIDVECAPHSSAILTDIVKNGNAVSTAYCRGSNGYDNTGTMAVISLEIGDKVFLRMNKDINSVQLGAKTTFSGFLTGFAPDSSGSIGILPHIP